MALALDVSFSSVRFLTYGKELDGLEPHADAFFVDICPSTRLDEWAALEPVVLDHHPTALAAVSKLGGRFGLNEKRESGAALALEYLRFHGKSGIPVAAPAVAKLIAIRDTWDRSDELLFSRASSVSSAVAELPMPLLSVLLCDPRCPDLLQHFGYEIRSKRIAECQEAVAAGIVFPWRGMTVRLIQGTGYTSDGAEMCDEDILIGFKTLSENRVVFSMRSRKGVNVGAIAKAAGGGGHDAAAGFTVTTADLEKRTIAEVWRSAAP